MTITPELVITMLFAICALVLFDLFFTYKLYSSVQDSDNEWVKGVEEDLDMLKRSKDEDGKAIRRLQDSLKELQQRYEKLEKHDGSNK